MRFQSLTVAVVGFLVLSGSSVAPILAQSTPTVNVLAEPPDTPVGEELAWFIDLLNGNSELLSERDVATHFTPAALSELSPPFIIAYARQFAEASGPATFLAAARPARPNHLVGYLSGRDDATFLFVLATEATSPNRLTGVALLPAPPPASLPAMAPESLGGVFDVGGRTMFLSCSGTGSPTVILEAGYGDSGGLWAPVQNGIAPLTRVCSYDRPNVSAGASDPAPTPRSAADQVVDLHALLAAAQIPGPYILVAHSYGGLISRLYASTYADDVAGVVLIDTVHEDRALQRQEMVSPEQWAALRDLEAQFRDFEKLDQEASWSQVRAAQRSAPLRPMPLVVLAAGRAADPSYLPAGWPLAEEEQLHQQLQLDLAHLVPGGEYMLVKESGHYIQHEQPDLVIDAVGEMVSAVRNHGAQGTPVIAEPGPTTLAVSLDALLLAGVNEGLQGVALQVDQGNDVLFTGAEGLASREAGTPLAPSDRFRIYSVTKTFTAVLMLQLVDAGVLSLDDPVTDWLDDPVVARIPNIDQVTLRQLLTHTSGIYDYFDEDSPFWQDAYLGEEADWSRVWTPEELLAYADGARHAPYFAPGEGVHYSNTGYILLGLVVEEASGESFGDRLRRQILDPLGLVDTVFAADEGVPAGAVDGYQMIGGELVNVSATHLSAQWAEGGLVSSTRDLARFADALFGGELVTAASLNEMLSFVPSERPGIDWGLGIARMQTPGGEVIGMGGSGPGFAARMFRQPETDLTLVLLSNTALEDDTVDTLFEQAMQAALLAARP